jgi:DNA-binding beta-propeller fold protein YncE
LEMTTTSAPIGVSFVSFTYLAYVTLTNGDIVYLDSIPQSLHSQAITELTGNQLNSIAITPDGKKACISISNSGKVAVLNLESQSVEYPLIDVGGNPQGIAISPDGQTALVANTVSASVGYDNKISAINLTSNAVVDTIKVENNSAFPINIAFTPDGKYAYVVNQTSENVTVIRMDLIK